MTGATGLSITVIGIALPSITVFALHRATHPWGRSKVPF